MNLGTLTLEDDNEETHTFRVTTADYNHYEKLGARWLSIYCRADEQISPPDNQNPKPWVEINIPLDNNAGHALNNGDQLTAVAYHTELGNLTNFYYYAHSGFENAQIQIHAIDAGGVVMEIRGEGDDSPVVISAKFVRNPHRYRSIT